MCAEKITNANILQANHVIKTLQPAIDVLKKIDCQSLTYCRDDLEVCKKAISMLELHVDSANDVLNTLSLHQEAIQNSGLVNRVVQRFFHIDKEIKDSEKLLQDLHTDHEFKVDELKHRGFSTSQIESIQPFPESDVNELNKKIEKLEATKNQLDLFIKSSPVYELELLRGTEFEDQISQQAA